MILSILLLKEVKLGIFIVEDFFNLFELSLKNLIVDRLPVDFANSDAIGETLDTSGLCKIKLQ
jgi:hypothetical protein